MKNQFTDDLPVSRIAGFSDQDLSLKLEEIKKHKKKLTHEIDLLDTYLVGLKEELRRRHEKSITHTTCGGDSDDV